MDGSSTVYRISKAAQEAFEARSNPDVTVVVDNHGTGGGFSRYLQGEVDIVDASRTAKPDEESRAKAQGIEWTRFLVGYDGITLVVNSKNTFVKSLTVDQLKKLWQPDLQRQDLEGPRCLLARPQDHSLLPRQRLGNVRVLHRGDRRQGEEPARRRADSSDDNTLVSGVAHDEDGLGYFGYAYYAANKEAEGRRGSERSRGQTRAAQSRDDRRQVVQAPLAPLVHLCQNSAARRPEVKQFLNFYLDNIQKLAVRGIRSPTADELKENKDTLAKIYPGAETAAAAPAAGSQPSPASK